MSCEPTRRLTAPTVATEINAAIAIFNGGSASDETAQNGFQRTEVCAKTLPFATTIERILWTVVTTAQFGAVFAVFVLKPICETD